MPSLVGDLLSWVLGLVELLGYPGLAVVVALENVFPPIPSEAVLPLAGFLVGQGRMTFVGAALAATAGSVAGALVLYSLGAVYGEQRVRGLVRRYGCWLGIAERDLDRAQGWFRDHGGSAVFFGRLAPLVRSLVSVPAGVARMPLGAFVLYTALGSGLWNAALIGAGWLFGANWWLVERYQKAFGTMVAMALVVLAVWFVGRRLMGDGRAGAERQAAPD